MFARAPPRFQIRLFRTLFQGPRTSAMCTVLHAIVAAALPLLAGSSAPAARQETGPRRGLLLAWLCRVGAGWGCPIGAERSQMPFFWNDLVWSAAIGLVLAALAPALPNQFAQTAPSGPPTSSMARSATLKRMPASSIMYIFPYAIVTAALSHLAGSSPPAPRPCMHGHHGRARTKCVSTYF